MKYAKNSILALMVFMPGLAPAQEQLTDADKAKLPYIKSMDQLPSSIATLAIGQGPYTLKESFGVFGYVIAREGETVTFQPCTGEVIEVQESQLEETPFGCQHETPPDGNPVTVACNDVPPAWGKSMGDILANANSDKVGTIYLEQKDGQFVQTVPTDVKAIQEKFASVETFQPCGGIVAGFNSSGEPIAAIVAVDPGGTINME